LETLGKWRVSELGTGAWAWGDRFVWDYRGDDKTLQETFQKVLDLGINFLAPRLTGPLLSVSSPYSTSSPNPPTYHSKTSRFG